MVNKNIKKLCEIGELCKSEGGFGLYVYLGLEDGSKKHKILKNRLHRFYMLSNGGVYLFSDYSYQIFSPL